MNLADLIDAMAAAGAPTAAIAIAVRAIEDERAELASRRAAVAERKRRERALSRDSHATVTRQSVDTVPIPPKTKSAPRPPEKTQPPLTPQISEANASSPRPSRGAFAEFWIACPRKRGKGAAEKSYRKALTLIASDDPHAVLMSALAQIKPEWAKLDPEHIPHPATWLNQRRWEDEIEVKRGTVPLGPMTPEQFSAWRDQAHA